MKYGKYCIPVLLLGGLSGCGGGSDGGGEEDNSLSVPDDALTITEGNSVATGSRAVEVAVAESLTVSDPTIVGGIDVTSSAALLSAAELIPALRQQLTADGAAEVAFAAGIEVNETCDYGGTITGNIDETENRVNGTLNFNNCRLVYSSGSGLDGSLNVDFRDNGGGDYSASISGSFSYELPGYGRVSYRGLSVSASGNDNSGDYAIRVDVAVSGISGGGFLFQTTQTFTGNDNRSPDCPSSGQFVVSGAGGTRLRATAEGTSVIVEYDDGNGNFTTVADSPVYCTRIF